MTLGESAMCSIPSKRGGANAFIIDYCYSFNLLMKALRHLLCAKNMRMVRGGGSWGEGR